MPQTQEIFIGAGCRLGGIIERLAQFNLAIPTGTCGSNGVAGLTMGGGVGFLARQFWFDLRRRYFYYSGHRRFAGYYR